MTLVGLVPILLALVLVFIPLLSDGPPSLPSREPPRARSRAPLDTVPPVEKELAAHQRTYERMR